MDESYDIASDTEAITCILCGSNNFSVIYPAKYEKIKSRNDLLAIYLSSSDEKLIDQMVSCRHCSLVYLNPRIRRDIILNAYKNARDATFITQNDLRIKTFKRVLQNISKRLAIYPSRNIKILDIGCAGGAFPKAASDIGFDIVGIEPSSWMASTAAKKYSLDIRAGTLSDYDFDAGSFDIITLWDVIEHISDPTPVLEQIYMILKSDGYLIVNYPDYGSLMRKILGRNWPFLLNVHLFYFTRKTIVDYLKKSGFQTVTMNPYFQTLTLGYISERAGHYLNIFQSIKKIFEYIHISNWALTYHIGQTLVIAKKY